MYTPSHQLMGLCVIKRVYVVDKGNFPEHIWMLTTGGALDKIICVKTEHLQIQKVKSGAYSSIVTESSSHFWSSWVKLWR